MRKKVALLVLSLSAIAAAGAFSPPVEARCIWFDCPNGEVVYCCNQPCCPPIEA